MQPATDFSKLKARGALCAGRSKERTRAKWRAKRGRGPESSLRPHLARAADAVFERRQLLDADGTARVHPAGRDADLAAEAELAAVGELGRGIVQHNGGIDLAQEFLGRFLIGGDDRIGVMRAVALNMRDCG